MIEFLFLLLINLFFIFFFRSIERILNCYDQPVAHRKIHNKKIEGLRDLDFCEFIALLSLAILVIALGIFPSLISNFFSEQSAQLSIFVNTLTPLK